MMKKISASGLRWLWIAVLVLLLDRISKTWALHSLTLGIPVPIADHFNLVLQYNKGAAFSFLGHASGWQTWLFGALAVVVSGVIVFRLKRMSFDQRWLGIAFSLVVGGALGNLWDRIYYGQVVDFIDLYAYYSHWPVFNLADSAICLGAVMLFIDALFLRKVDLE